MEKSVECPRCGKRVRVKGAGLMYRHTMSVHRADRTPCPGSSQTVETVREAFAVTDVIGLPIETGHRVAWAQDGIMTAGIVSYVAWDHPNDIQPGSAWLTIDEVTWIGDGDMVTGQQFRDVRASRVARVDTRL